MSLDFRKNANVLTAIHGFAKPKERTPGDLYVVDGYELRASPELVDRLKVLMTYTPGAKLEFAYGIPVLYAPNGRIFATAGGKYHLNLYLPETEKWGRPHEEYGRPWREGYAWTAGRPPLSGNEDDFSALMRSAYD